MFQVYVTLENTNYILFYSVFELNLGVILSFALLKPAACISQIKNSSKLEVVLS